ncbi:MAG TPA: M28 family peptidase [Planctomycetota bacterium]|nr:M28 family peptidase [Planctomycetota bacterium]
MLRFFAALLLAAPLQIHAQEDPALREKVDRAVEAASERLREAILESVRRDLQGGAPAPAPPPAAGAAKKAEAVIAPETLRRHATFLSSDDLEGRAAGWPGNDKAGDYIADVFKAAGLQPAGDQGTYFQAFKVGGRPTRNVVGLLEGRDPALKDEIVVVGAHYDHVGTSGQPDFGRLGGRGGDDGIWNGADDNASGTSTLLGIAEAMGKGNLRARRTIVFIAFSGEEAGLIGSAFYTRKPVGTIDRHVFMLNLDMVGRNPHRPIELHGVGSAEGGVIRQVAERAVAAADLNAKLNDGVKLVGGDSDHSSFRDKRIPYAFFFSGFHADYHRPSDTADKLAYDNMAKVGRASVDILLGIGDLDERPRFSGAAAGPRFRLPDFGEPPTGPSPRRLGVTVQELDAEECEALGLVPGQGGLRVDAVHPLGPAQAAGVKDGDVVLSLAGVKLPRADAREALRKVLAEKVKPGQEVELVVLRQGTKQTLAAKWVD